MEVQALERQEGEEQPSLLARDEGHRSLDLRGILFEEADRVDLDVGVASDLVRVRVVAGVLGVPPRVADADDAVREDAADAVVRGARREDLLVRRLVGEERHLREDDAECGRDEQLEPAVSQQDEACDATAEREQEGCRDGAVEHVGAAQQARLADDFGDLRVRTGDRGEGLRAGVRLSNGAESGLQSLGCDDRFPLVRVPAGGLTRSHRRMPIA